MHAFVDTEHIIQARKTNPWAQNMADNLSMVIKKAVKVYQNHPDEYYQMILNGFRKVRQFSWEDNVKKYYKIYEMISKR
jgi:glycogen synthase